MEASMTYKMWRNAPYKIKVKPMFQTNVWLFQMMYDFNVA